jgi:hypothetical protein
MIGGVGLCAVHATGYLTPGRERQASDMNFILVIMVVAIWFLMNHHSLVILTP